MIRARLDRGWFLVVTGANGSGKTTLIRLCAGLLAPTAGELRVDAGRARPAVGTGGDPGHAPARAAYEAFGFTLLPGARYLKLLD